jgi:hypothetical protein
VTGIKTGEIGNKIKNIKRDRLLKNIKRDRLLILLKQPVPFCGFNAFLIGVTGRVVYGP